MLVVHRPKTSCTYFPEASLCHRPTDHRQEQFSILKYEEVLIFCHATLPTTMRVVLRVSIHIFPRFLVIIFVISKYARSSIGMLIKTLWFPILSTLWRHIRSQEYQHKLETLQHGWYVCIQVALIKKSILIISYHDVKMVSWIRLNDSVTTAFF